MNMHSTPSFEQSLKDNYADVRRRLYRPARAVKDEPIQLLEKVEPYVFKYRCQQPKDAHVRAWQWHVAQNACVVQKHIRRRAAEFGVSVEDLSGSCRFKHIIVPRQTIMYELRTQFGLSFPEIGRKFGGRDHTTALHAYRKIAAKIADEGKPFPATLPPGQLEVVRLRAQGRSNKDVETILGIAKETRKRRIQRAMASMGAESMVALIEMAKQRGWLE